MILITGATGFIGSYLIKELDNKKIRYKILSRRNCIGNCIKTDLSNREKILKIDNHFDTIIHLGGIIDETDKQIFKVNVLGTKNLIELAEKLKVKKFIYISTSLVNFENIKTNYTESKRKAEKIIRDSKIKWTILRPSQVYGENEKRNFGELINFIRKNPIIPIIKGPYKLQPVFINEVICAIIRCLDDKATDYKILNLVGPDLIKFSEIENLIIKAINRPKLKIIIPEIITDFFIRNQKYLPKILYQRLVSLNYLKQTKFIDNQTVTKDLSFLPSKFKEKLKLMIVKIN